MRNELRMGVFVFLLVGAITLTILSYSSHDHAGPVMLFLSSQHILITLLLVFVSIGFGYVWSSGLQGALVKEQKNSEELVSLVKELLSADERVVISLLVENDGKIFQSDIARKKHMTRVKAHRAVKALEKRGVVRAERDGKQVVVLMKRSLFNRLKQ